ncbi:MAG: ATP synthase subunit I [Deltaproteobacteria bacterium]|nr:ATP synthase subunit I [Deltaproteobacteria bacterium]
MAQVEAPNTKDIVQKRIEYLSFIIWLTLCIFTLLIADKTFALGVFWGGVICLANFQWMSRHARRAVKLPAHKGTSYMIIRFILRLTAIGAAVVAVFTWTHASVIGLFLGLSVVVVSIMGYACFTYLFAGGD